MAKHLETGRKGEHLAKAYLVQKGWKILELNWRFKRAEVDVIGMDGETLVFVEVKTRSSTAFGQPEEFVDERKQQFLSDAASAYMEAINHNWEIRFDIISVILHEESASITHFEDAFFS